MKLTDIFNAPKPPDSPTILVTDELAQEMESLPPGKAIEIKTRGRTFVIIDRDDFEHIAATGGMGLKPESGSNG